MRIRSVGEIFDLFQHRIETCSREFIAQSMTAFTMQELHCVAIASSSVNLRPLLKPFKFIFSMDLKINIDIGAYGAHNAR